MNPTPPSDLALPAWLQQLSDPAVHAAWLNLPALSGQPAFEINDLQKLIDPATLSELQASYLQQLNGLWQDLMAARALPLADKRFQHSAWHENALHGFNAAAYLLNGRFLLKMVDAMQAADKQKQRIRFAVQQLIDAMSPANFLATNPEAQKRIVDTQGESMARGIAHMLADFKKRRISQSDESAFAVGRNVAITAGAVVYENDLFQLLQYQPSTTTVYQKPLLIVPPCINKFYILDLQPHNSLVRYAVAQGHTVFLMSWRNPDAALGHLTWDDYIVEGVINAIHLCQKISASEQINTFGFCVGGTLLSSALALLYGRGEKPAASISLLTAFLDFSDTGIIDVFIDEAQVQRREQAIGQGGLMPGSEFANAFSSLRANDLVWNYVKSNYLKGEEPAPFDLLFWNADTTNLPGPMFCWYLRHTYLENALKVPGRVKIAGQKLDLRKIDAPAFIYGSREDHIVPWHSAFKSMRLLNPQQPQKNQFVLGASGHIAGVINPADKNKRSYWINPEWDNQVSDDADAWLAGATEHPGSWWPQWMRFLAAHAGPQISAPTQAGNAEFKALEPAPGRYVMAKSD